jgi:penicillin amidase
MGIVWRLLRLAIVLALIGAIVAGGLAAFITYRAMPQTSGTIGIAGLENPVSVIRDDAGIARIYADSPHDLFLAQGYVHAQDRLWQMEVWRHISAGRLSELFGTTTLDTDKFIRTLDFRGAAERDMQTFGPELMDALEAYADGVNAYIDQHRGSLGLAFVVTGVKTGKGGIGGYDPEPWTPLDSAAWQKVQSWNLGGNFRTELFRMLADERLGDPARTDSLFPDYPSKAPVITPSGLKGSGGAGASLGPANDLAAADRDTARSTQGNLVSAGGGTAQSVAWRRLAEIGGSVSATAGLDDATALAGSHGIGSNEWVVAPDRSATGGALFANDPHLGLGIPSVWYMNGLHCRDVSAKCPYDVVGVSFPGVPAIVLGHNARIAWGATNAGPDVQDLVVETPDPNDEHAYVFKGTSQPYEVRTEEIKVAGSATVKLEVRTSRHGPILNGVVDELEDAPPTALRWTALAAPDGTLDAIFKVNTATNFQEFRAALRTFGSPSQNFVYADVEGHIGYQLPGYIPRRSGNDRGDRPVSGDGNHEWTGRVAYKDLPWQLDPPVGVIVSANNAAVDAEYPYFISDGWDRGDRAQRILDLLHSADASGVTMDELRSIQRDTLVLRAERLIKALPAAVPATGDGKVLLSRIKSWDHKCPVDSVGCAAYMAFELRLIGAIFEDELGPLTRDYVGADAAWAKTIDLLGHPDDPWWDDTATDGVTETAPLVVTTAIDRTASELRTALGEPDSWTWGRLHKLTLREDIYGKSGIGPLEWYFNAGTREAPGAAGAIDNLYYKPEVAYPDPYEPGFKPVGLDGVFAVTNGPSYRLTIDMSDLESARIVQTTGQSGNPFDKHYSDLVDRWLRGDSVPLPFSRSAVENGVASRLTLEPVRPRAGEEPGAS